MPSSGSFSTLTKLSSPTHCDVIRFVFWKLMTNDWTIGDQLKTAKTRISGSAKSRFDEAAAADPGADAAALPAGRRRPVRSAR